MIKILSKEDGILQVLHRLYQKCSSSTLLFLSGGKTPKELYRRLAQEKRLVVGAVAMVDERPDGSNEKMIRATGLITYLEEKSIPFYPILEDADYEATVTKLFNQFSKRVAILGIGSDGHTAGLPANFQFPISNEFVISHDKVIGGVKGRISLSFGALAQLDQMILLVFGDDKKEALKKMFEKGSEEEIPARFYTRPDVAKKVILITDQKL